MKTLHLTNAWHASSGGIGTFYRALFETANRERHWMRLVVPADSTRVEEVGEFGRIYHVAAPVAPLDRNYRMLYPYRFLFPGTAIQRIINDERPDLVEISEKYTLPYLGGLLRTGRLPGVSVRPVVVGISHERMDESMVAYLSAGAAARRFCEFYMRRIYFPMFDHHITVSPHTAEELIHAGRGHKVRRGIFVCPMGVDCDRFHGSRRSSQRKESATVIVYAGRLSPEKNLSLLIDTMALLDPGDFRMTVAGAGIELDRLRADCERRGIRGVSFLGHIADRDQLADLYANADIFMHPNPREPFGIAPLEAMASGLAVVAPNCGGVTSYANDRNAWLANPNPVEFAAAARSVRAHEVVRREKAIAARQTAEGFRWSRVTSRFLELYRDMVTSAPTINPHSWSTPGDYLGREITVGQ